MPDSANPTRSVPERFHVAISFAGEQRELVRGIADEVEKCLGRETVFYDEWFEYYLAGDDADLKLQEIYGKKCALAVVCVSSHYGNKPWTKAEHRAVRARQMQANASTDPREHDSVLPIRVGDGEVEGILFNAIVPDVRTRSAADSARLIIDRLRFVAPGLVPEAESLRKPDQTDWPEAPPLLSWPMADHSGAREAFASLLTRAVPWRFLPIRGSSETGKSHITRQMLANALAIPNIACGRFDFKGTTGMDSEVSAFAQFLDVAVPAPSQRLQERLGHILAGLKQRSHPALLIFDTYEMAGETEDWIEKQLLPNLIRAAWLRVVVAGQKVPDAAGAWACPTVQLLPPPPRDWLDYGRQHRGDLTLADVETACRLASDKASLLAAMLGPAK